jgi:hypothetical protein
VDFSSKTPKELANLRANAEAVLADPSRAKLHAAARERLAVLPPPRPAAGRRGGAAAGDTATDRAVALLRELAAAAEVQFDVSPPEGTRQAHKLSDKGAPKVGGRQRRRMVAADRYLSHKRGEAVVTIGWIRLLDEDVATGGRWYTAYTDAETLPPPEAGLDFAAARHAFLARLEEIGTPRR